VKPEDRGTSWSVEVRTEGEEARVYALEPPQVRKLKLTLVLVALIGLAMILVLIVTVPRSMAYSRVVQENLAIKSRLHEIDRTMSEVDRVLLRLRLYDAQLQSVGTPDGDHGPLPAPVLPHDDETVDALADGDLDRVFAAAMDEDGPWLEATDLSPGEAWAISVQARAETFLDLFEKAEPDLSQLMEDLEDMKLLKDALPSVWPTRGDFTSGFGWRKNPLGQRWRFHSGIDIAERRGTPIYAVGDGTVVRAFFNEGYGRMVEIDHGFGISTVYAHCHVIRVREGQRVDAGDLIGTMGSTGRVTGPHLHFEVRLEGHAVNPLDYLPRMGLAGEVGGL